MLASALPTLSKSVTQQLARLDARALCSLRLFPDQVARAMERSPQLKETMARIERAAVRGAEIAFRVRALQVTVGREVHV